MSAYDLVQLHNLNYLVECVYLIRANIFVRKGNESITESDVSQGVGWGIERGCAEKRCTVVSCGNIDAGLPSRTTKYHA